jgi:hypothetical protein
VQFVDVSLTSINPDIMTVKGDADFQIRGTGFVDNENVQILFHPKVCF